MFCVRLVAQETDSVGSLEFTWQAKVSTMKKKTWEEKTMQKIGKETEKKNCATDEPASYQWMLFRWTRDHRCEELWTRGGHWSPIGLWGKWTNLDKNWSMMWTTTNAMYVHFRFLTLARFYLYLLFLFIWFIFFINVLYLGSLWVRFERSRLLCCLLLLRLQGWVSIEVQTRSSCW